MSVDTLYPAETPEGIGLALRPAGVAPRFLAYLIDFFVRGLLFLVLSIGLGLLGGVGKGLILVAYFVLEWLYPVVFELMPRHATPGKRSLGLTVIMDTGLPITPAASLLRNLLRVVDFLPAAYALGMLSMICRSDFKRLGDLAAGTLVVYNEQVSLHAKIPDADPIAPTRALSFKEQAAVVAWASRSPRLTPSRTEELAEIAESILPPQRMQSAATPALLGVAQWLLGRR